MKKRIVIYLACLAGLVLASSCSVRDTVMKRHYMKGYYVDKHERAHTTSIAQQQTDKKERSEEMHTLSELSLQPENMPSPVLTKRTEGDIVPIASRTSKAPAGKEMSDVRPIRPSVHLKEMIELKKPLAADRDGLSLFWIVILVILILWAIGFLGGGFGLGALINLLLVVALILLILWLLKII